MIPIKGYQYTFFSLSKVWSLLHHGLVWRVHKKMLPNAFIYFFWHFVVFMIRFVFLSFSFLLLFFFYFFYFLFFIYLFFLMKCLISATEYETIRSKNWWSVSAIVNVTPWRTWKIVWIFWEKIRAVLKVLGLGISLKTVLALKMSLLALKMLTLWRQSQFYFVWNKNSNPKKSNLH